MITEIHMDAVASFRHSTSLVTDKKINLVYGLNGTGKSTISNFLYSPDDERYAACCIKPENTPPIFVYNQKFIQDHFFIADRLKGIFSLSKENKAAEEQIADATKIQTKQEPLLEDKRAIENQIKQDFEKQRQHAVNEVWKIKTEYSGGDRVLEYCLEGLKGQKEKLFDHLLEIPKPEKEPEKTIQELKSEVDAIKGTAAKPQEKLPLVSLLAKDLESSPILETSILGNADSEVADLIEKLNNSDWVKQGLAYIPEMVDEEGDICPFCQEKTISANFLSNLRGYFDDTYQKQLSNLEELHRQYVTEVEKLPNLSVLTEHDFATKHKIALTEKYASLQENLRKNLEKIERKLRNPKTPIALESSEDALSEVNEEIMAINKEIDAYNDQLKNRDSALSSLREQFWSLMRWKYDQVIERLAADRQTKDQKLSEVSKEITQIESKLFDAKNRISAAQKETVNVDAAVDAINSGLLDLGINDFEIQKHAENRYRVVRAGGSKDVFHTLSEGEKMIISFLYFCELCKGRSSADDTHSQCIAVIDDPISSMSHVFIFNVGQLIRSIFFKGNRINQVVVLTHSLYFFYELTDPNHDRRKDTQKLFRISKPSTGSVIQEMKYEEIQNDYQAYWSVVNDPDQPPALIANCMRNIVEYFFNFVRKRDLNNVFLMPELKDVKFQAFCRYINRESHSLGQNILDMKEFDYNIFKEGLRLVFEKAGYPEHYKAMSKV